MHNEPRHNLDSRLTALAVRYNQKDFILTDPVQFPHRYSEKKDIEVSAFVTAWISWGNRKQIIKTAEHLHTHIFQDQPYLYLQSRRWETYKDDPACFYRTIRNKDFHDLMERLWAVYQAHADLEHCVLSHMEQGLNPAEALSQHFRGVAGIADSRKTSPCKRLWFFLRWMVRRDGIVDLGIWQQISPATLLIPLDTHVYHTALEMGITHRRSADIRTAREITNYFRRIFPDDPALGDFALFGYGVESPTSFR